MDNYERLERNCAEFDGLSKRTFDLHADVNLGALEVAMITSSKRRKGSVALGEDIFRSALPYVDHLFEVGGNIGSHTKQFLRTSNLLVHAFEPNFHLLEHYGDILDHPQLNFNPYGLSSENGISNFTIITSVGGMDSRQTHGLSSFEDVESAYSTSSHGVSSRRIIAAHCKGEHYINACGLNESGSERMALWVDTEGHGLEVLKGFGDTLELFDALTCEVEIIPSYTGKTNADEITKMCVSHGLVPFYRDFQFFGRFNLIAFRKELIRKLSSAALAPIEKYRKQVKIHAKAL